MARKIEVTVSQGPTIGEYRGSPIPAWVFNRHRGGRHEFVGIATECRCCGEILMSQLADDELMLSPGLIYKRVKL